MFILPFSLYFFFFNDTATTEIYTLSLHDALPIYLASLAASRGDGTDPRLPDDAVASGVHAVSFHAQLLAVHARGGRAPRCTQRELARREAHPALPPVAPGRLRPGALGPNRGTTRHPGNRADAHRGGAPEHSISAKEGGQADSWRGG